MLNKFLAILTARNKEFYRDKGTLGWTFLFPFIVLLGFTYGYADREEALFKVGVHPPQASESPLLRDFLSIGQLQVIPYEDLERARSRIERHQLDLLIESVEPRRIRYAVNPDSSKGELASRLLAKSDLGGARAEATELKGRKIRYADWLVPGLLGMNLMFNALFGVGYVIVRYRKNGVLKRLRATPLSAFEFLAAQIVSRMLLLLITSGITLGGAVLLIGFPIEGSLLDFTLLLAVGSAAMISLGLVVAARIASEEVAEGVLNLMTWPMIFLSGVWFSLEGASDWVIRLSKVLPLTPIVHGMRSILLDGESITNLGPELLGLAISSGLFLAVGSLIFRWR